METFYTIDLTDLLVVIVSFVFPVIGYFASLAFRALADKFHMQANSERRDLIEKAILNGIAKAEAIAVQFAKDNGRVMTKNEKLAVVANHVAKTATSAQQKLKITPDELLESIKARLPEAKAAVEVAKQDAALDVLMPQPKPVEVVP